MNVFLSLQAQLYKCITQSVFSSFIFILDVDVHSPSALCARVFEHMSLQAKGQYFKKEAPLHHHLLQRLVTLLSPCKISFLDIANM